MNVQVKGKDSLLIDRGFIRVTDRGVRSLTYGSGAGVYVLCRRQRCWCSSSSSSLLKTNGPGFRAKGSAVPQFQQEGPGPPQWHCRIRKPQERKGGGGW